MRVHLDYRLTELKPGITIECKLLETWAYQKLLSYLGKLNAGATGTQMQQFSDPEFLELAKAILSAHCRNLRGIELEEDGKVHSAEVSDLLKYGMFLDLCFIILSKLFINSQLSKVDEVELKKPLAS